MPFASTRSRPNITAGRQLRKLRESLGLRMQDVYDASAQLASARSDSRFVIPPSRLSEFESGLTVPNIFRVCALAHAYHVPMRRLLRFYGAA